MSTVCAPFDVKMETGILIEFAVGFDIIIGAILSSWGNGDVETRFPFKNPTGVLRGLLLPLLLHQFWDFPVRRVLRRLHRSRLGGF